MCLKVALRVGVPPSELERTWDYTDFIEVLCYMDIELKEYTKMDYYLAQIAAMNSGNKNAKVKDFLIKFEEPKENKEHKEEDGEAIAERFKQAFGAKTKDGN